MSDPATAGLHKDSDGAEIPPWWVRDGGKDDLPEVAHALAQLLAELSGTTPSEQELEVAAAEAIADPERGCLLVVDTVDEGLVGVLAASWQHAIHVPGRYCILQDLWTHPAWRSQGVGAALVAELLERMREEDVDRVEVGLPSDCFAALAATEAFYRKNGFAQLGPRMRQMLR
jgi:branched-chain amino acid aminotransferase